MRFSSLFAAGDVSRGGTSATQWQKFHTDDANQCLHNKSSSHGVLNINLSNFTCLLVNFGKVLCLSANELQQNSNASSREDYIPQIFRVWARIWSLGDNLSPWLKFWGTFSFLGGQRFVHPSFLAGLQWWVSDEKVKFGGIFRDRFAEKSADLAGVFGANFTEKESVKNGRFCGYFQGKFR